MARVRAALRRDEEPEPFVLGDLALDFGRRRVTVGESEVELTVTEYELTRVPSLTAGRVVTYGTLQRRVWARHASPNPIRVRILVCRRRIEVSLFFVV